MGFTEVDSFRSLKQKKKSKSKYGRNSTTDSYSENSSNQSQDATTLSSTHLPKQETNPPASIIPSQTKTIAPLPMSQPPVVSPNNTPQKEVVITNEKSLTEHSYSEMKPTAQNDTKLMIQSYTEESKEEIGNAKNKAKR